MRASGVLGCSADLERATFAVLLQSAAGADCPIQRQLGVEVEHALAAVVTEALKT